MVLGVISSRSKSLKIDSILGICVVAISSVVLFGWIVDVRFLQSILPHFPSVNPMTAIGLLFAGIALSRERSGISTSLCVTALVPIAIGALKLSDLLLGTNIQIASLLFQNATSPAKEMATGVASNLVLVGGAIVLMRLPSRAGHLLAQAAAVAMIMTSLFALSSYLYFVESLYGLMAFHVAIGFLILALGVLYMRPGIGLMEIVTAATSGGSLIRQLLPVVILIPLVIGWIHMYGQKAKWYGEAEGTALLSVSITIIISILVWFSGKQFHKTDLRRRDAEQTLALNELMLRSFFDSAPMMMGIVEVTDNDIRQLRTNEATGRFFGTSPAKIQNQWAREFGTPQQIIDNWIAHYRKSKSWGEPVTFEYDHDNNDRVRHLVATVSYIGEGMDGLERYSYIVDDITERKQAELKLDRFFKQSQNLLAVMSADGHFKIFNDAWVTTFGYSRNELSQNHYLTLIHPDDTEVSKANLENLLQHQQSQSVERRLVCKDGTVRNMLFNLTPFTSEQQIFVTGQDITERRLAEEEVRESRDFLRNVINTVADPVFVKDRQHCFVLCNDSFARLLGKRPEDVIGRSDYDVASAAEADAFWEDDELVFATGKEKVIENSFLVNGARRTTATKKTVYTDIGGHSYIVGVVRDDTELREQREELATVLETVGEGITLSNASGHFEIFNSKMEEITGYSKEEANAYSDFAALLYPTEEDHQLALDGLKEILETGSAHDVETSIVAKNGQKKDLLVSTSIVERDGQTLFLSAYRDITARTKVERAINVQKTYFERLFESSPEAIALVSSDDRVLRANGRFLQVFGYKRGEVIGQDLSDLIVPPEFIEQSKDLSLRVSQGETIFEEGVRRRKDGSTFESSIVGTPIYVDGYRELYVIYRDISERKRSESEREKLIEELQHALTEVKTLSGLLPMCAWCKKIRDDDGYYHQIEKYIATHTNARFTHGICPDCKKNFKDDVG